MVGLCVQVDRVAVPPQLHLLAAVWLDAIDGFVAIDDGSLREVALVHRIQGVLSCRKDKVGRACLYCGECLIPKRSVLELMHSRPGVGYISCQERASQKG